MAPSIEAVLDLSVPANGPFDRIAHRKAKLPLTIVEADPSWPAAFNLFKSRIESALGSTALSIEHVGSTSVPGLPAKAVIDIDLIVKEISDEGSYVPALEDAGFQFLIREPGWYEHRFFGGSDPLLANLHVWSPDSPEAARHKIFRNWLLDNEADRVLYADVKRQAAEISTRNGEDVNQYTVRKDKVVHEILHRAFRGLGYL